MGQIEDLQNKKYPTTWKMRVATIIIIAFSILFFAFWIFQIAHIGK